VSEIEWDELVLHGPLESGAMIVDAGDERMIGKRVTINPDATQCGATKWLWQGHVVCLRETGHKGAHWACAPEMLEGPGAFIVGERSS